MEGWQVALLVIGAVLVTAVLTLVFAVRCMCAGIFYVLAELNNPTLDHDWLDAGERQLSRRLSAALLLFLCVLPWMATFLCHAGPLSVRLLFAAASVAAWCAAYAALFYVLTGSDE